MALLREESVAEMAIVRRGDQAAVQRIAHLKAQAAAQERHIELLTASLAAQSDMLRDVATFVASVVQALPPPSHGGAPAAPLALPEDRVAVLRTLHQRLQRGTAERRASAR